MKRQAASRVSVADAKRCLSDLLGRVAYGGESVIITRRGRPMAKLSPVDDAGQSEGLGAVRGWLEDDDPFLVAVDARVAARAKGRPRALRSQRPGGR